MHVLGIDGVVFMTYLICFLKHPFPIRPKNHDAAMAPSSGPVGFPLFSLSTGILCLLDFSLVSSYP